MEGRHIPFRSKLRKIQQKRRDTPATQKRDRGRRVERDECHRIQGFIHELYQELLNLAVAARSVLDWALPQVSLAHSLQGLAPTNDRDFHSPANRNGLDDRKAHIEGDRSEKGSEKTAAEAFSSCEPPSTVPDALESGVQGQGTRRECGPLLTRLPPASWTANSFEDDTSPGIGATRDQSEQNARSCSRKSVEIIQQDSDATSRRRV
jgi:hypothetical protein